MAQRYIAANLGIYKLSNYVIFCSYASFQLTYNSRFWVYYEVKQSSNYEFIKKSVESSLSVCSML